MTTSPEAMRDAEGTSTPEIPAAAEAAPPAEAPAAAAQAATWTVSDWFGKFIIDKDGERIGKLHDVYVDVETDQPQFGTVKEGFFDRHLTFVPLVGLSVGPDSLRATVEKSLVKSAPDLDLQGQEMSQADESALYHHFGMNYTPPTNVSGRRLAKR